MSAAFRAARVFAGTVSGEVEHGAAGPPTKRCCRTRLEIRSRWLREFLPREQEIRGKWYRRFLYGSRAEMCDFLLQDRSHFTPRVV